GLSRLDSRSELSRPRQSLYQRKVRALVLRVHLDRAPQQGRRLVAESTVKVGFRPTRQDLGRVPSIRDLAAGLHTLFRLSSQPEVLDHSVQGRQVRCFQPKGISNST